MTSRRSFLQVAASMLIVPQFVVPRDMLARPKIDLSLFCDDYVAKWDLGSPFLQGGATYATDSRAAIKVDPIDLPSDAKETRRPNMDFLPWDSGASWRPWGGEYRHVRHHDSWECGHCRGRGRHGGHKHDQCGGIGVRDIGVDYEAECSCKTGYVGGVVCDRCKGTGQVPECLILHDGTQINPYYDWRIRTLRDVEYATVEWEANNRNEAESHQDGIIFRFDGGRGIVMPLASDR